MSKRPVFALLVLFSGALHLGKIWGQGSSEPDLVWTESTFKDFIDGTFGDAGANLYVAARGRIQTINRWDLNGDGYMDLVFANSHPHGEKMDAAIYWGNGEDFDISRTTFLPTNGAQWLIPADVNGDGHIDLLVPNYHNGTYDKMDSYLYLHGARSVPSATDTNRWNIPPFNKRIALPTQAAQHAAAADLNRDGYVDVVFAFSGGFWEYREDAYHPYQTPSRVYWGGPEGFARDRYTEIPTPAAGAVAIAELNGDAWPDLVLASHASRMTKDVDSHIYWGGPEGFSAQRRIGLPTRAANMARVADVNRDGKLDVVFANGEGEASFIYLRDGKSFSPARRLELKTMDARDVQIADVNRDGYPDIFFANYQDHGNPLTYSYLYLGSAQGFSNTRRLEFETVGAHGAGLADLNKDGLPDLVVTSFREFTSHEVPSYIYWNSPSGFDPLRRTPLYTQGAVGVTVADFNEDGNPDLLFANTTSAYRGDFQPAFVYWGDPTGQFSAQRRLSLPAVDTYEVAAGDLNDDGYADLVIVNSGEDRRVNQDSYIYWGSVAGFSLERRSGLMGYRAMGASLADLDRDGYLDVVLSNTGANADPKTVSFIYWGGPQGYSPLRRTTLPTGVTDAAAIADLNRDGHLDLMFSNPTTERGTAIYWGDGTRHYTDQRRFFVPGSAGTNNPELADLNKDGYLDLILARGGPLGKPSGISSVFWGDAKGEFSPEHRTDLPTEGACTPHVADLNGDGWLDVVFPNYMTGTSRRGMSRIFWGGPEGYSEKRILLLPTDGGTGALANDFNRDGYMDLLLVCHRREGNPDKLGMFNEHKTNSFLYWGGPKGFQADHKLEILTEGAHNDYGVDLGNIYNRSYQFDYISSPYHCESRVPTQIEWKGQTRFGSHLKFQIRATGTREGLRIAPWMGPEGINSAYEYSGWPVRNIKGAWVQYRAIFVSPDGVNYPVLEKVSIRFQR